MNTDVFFNQGSTHRVCEDYALASDTQVVISDGCSTGTHTDFGARLLAAAAMQHNRPTLRDDERWSRILASADVYRRSVGLPIQSLAATLLIVRIVEPVIAVDVLGDGTVMARRKEDGIFDIYNINFPSGAPYYLRYNISDSDQEEWEKRFGCERVITSWKWAPNWGRPAQNEELVQKLNDTRIIARTFQFPLEDYDLVAITSDGAESFLTTAESGETRRVSMFEVFREVLAFKNTRGEFVHKRCVKAFRQFRENGWENADDFSLAAIAGDN